MNNDNDSLHQAQPIQQKSTSPSELLKPPTLLATILFVAIIAGTGDYLLVIKNDQFVPPLQPSPTIIVQSTAPSPPLSTILAIMTMNYKIYMNEKLGLSFNYPNDWKVKLYSSANNSGESVHKVVDLAPFNYKENQYLISLVYYENPKNLGLEDLAQKLTGNSGMGPRLFSPRAKPLKMTNGIIAYYHEEYLCEPLICQTYIWSSKGKIFQLINYPPPAPQYRIPNQSKIFDKIFFSIQSR